MNEQKWSDRAENYCDGYTIAVNGSTSTAAITQDLAQPVVLFGIAYAVNNQTASGSIAISDGPGTATAGSTLFKVSISSGANGVSENFSFSRGLVCSAGVVLVATTITGSINLLYKTRY